MSWLREKQEDEDEYEMKKSGRKKIEVDLEDC
jgi:hypothetical protein